jgi:hypothetical protein
LKLDKFIEFINQELITIIPIFSKLDLSITENVCPNSLKWSSLPQNCMIFAASVAISTSGSRSKREVSTAASQSSQSSQAVDEEMVKYIDILMPNPSCSIPSHNFKKFILIVLLK